MTDRPILFKSEMVRAIQAGVKTMTRRVVKPKEPWEPRCEGGRDMAPHILETDEWAWCKDGEPVADIGRCPYGVPGDRLWVKEGIYRAAWPDGDDGIRYAADDEWAWDITRPCVWPWKPNSLPSMFMPYGLSRITLAVTGVRVERLREITINDVVAEGAAPWIPEGISDDIAGRLIADAWVELWNSINAKWKPIKADGEIVSYVCYPWSEDDIPTKPKTDVPCIAYPNPWTWIVEFQRIEP